MDRFDRASCHTNEDMEKINDRCYRIEREYRCYSEEMKTVNDARENTWYQRWREADTRMVELKTLLEEQDDRIKKLEKIMGKKPEGSNVYSPLSSRC